MKYRIGILGLKVNLENCELLYHNILIDRVGDYVFLSSEFGNFFTMTKYKNGKLKKLPTKERITFEITMPPDLDGAIQTRMLINCRWDSKRKAWRTWYKNYRSLYKEIIKK